MKIAYCILAHKNPEQVARLIRRIYSPSDYYYIHKDKSVPWRGWRNISQEYASGNVAVASKYRTRMGTFGLVEATLDGMNYWRHSEYHYFVHLSGQCYPIKPLTTIREELRRSEAAYMESFKLPSKVHWTDENGGLDRINYNHFRLWKWRIRIPRLNRTLPYNLEPYGGSHYFCLTKRCVDYVLDYLPEHPEIISFFRRSRIPEEMFFQTIIMNSPLRSEVVNEHKRYFRWEKGGGHPSVLRKTDFKELVESDKWIAKKFDIDIDKDILDLLDRAIEHWPLDSG